MVRCVIALTLTVIAAVASPFPIVDPEAYAVYAAILPEEWSFKTPHFYRAVLRQETATNWTCMASGKVLETNWKPVVDSFRRENGTVSLLQPGFLADPPFRLVPAAEMASALASGDWHRFYELYPRSAGYIEVSAVAFDDSKTRAMVYVGHHCGGMCGAGTHHFLEKRGEGWRPAQLDITNCMWES